MESRKDCFKKISVVKFQAFLYLCSHEPWYTTIEKGIDRGVDEVLTGMLYGQEMHRLVSMYLELSKNTTLTYKNHFVPFLKEIVNGDSTETKKIMGELFKEIDLSTREMLNEDIK